MNPYYQDELTTIWQGDARVLPIPDNTVHLVVTSPPYNCEVPYDGYSDRLSWEDYWHNLIEPVLRECYRVLVPGGRICVNSANVMRADGWVRFLLPELVRRLDVVGFLLREHITWIKGADESEVTDSGGTAWGSWRSAANPVLRALAEPIIVASKQQYRREPVGTSDMSRDEFLLWTRNVWFIRATGIRELHHPAAFPVELPRRLIKLYSYVGDTVLDPFAGSGSTLWAAKLTGRYGLGMDQSEQYCQMAANRVGQGILPLIT